MSRPKFYETKEIQPKTLLLGVYVLGKNDWRAEDYFEEFLSLCKTAELDSEHHFFMRLRQVRQTTFLSKGKLEELVTICNANNIEKVVFSTMLTEMQQRNIGEACNAKIIDRSQLILDIFKKSATTAEGQLQVEIAEIKTFRSKMAGFGREMGQQQAGAKARGPGETEKEYLSRYYANLLNKAEKKLIELKKTRDVQRRNRINSSKPLISLVGYTNAGKSSLMKALSKNDVLVEDKLFATLGTTTRDVFVGDNKTILLSDTVGFISDLPHHLVEAFRSTLDELRYADLLLQVIDISNPSWQKQVAVTMETLEEIGVEKPMLFVFNKVDKIGESLIKSICHDLEEFYSPYVLTSAKDKASLQGIKDFILSSEEMWHKGRK